MYVLFEIGEFFEERNICRICSCNDDQYEHIGGLSIKGLLEMLFYHLITLDGGRAMHCQHSDTEVSQGQLTKQASMSSNATGLDQRVDAHWSTVSM